jgi:plasmid stabilization system protein ParE
MSFLLSPAAKQDLIDIWSFIADDDIRTADKVLETFYEKFLLLSQQPYIGHTRKDLTQHPVLFWPVYQYLIIYKPKTTPLEIVRVLSGYRNLVDLL